MNQNLFYLWTQTVARNLPKQRNRTTFSLALARAQNCHLHSLAEHLPELRRDGGVRVGGEGFSL